MNGTALLVCELVPGALAVLKRKTTEGEGVEAELRGVLYLLSFFGNQKKEKCR